PRALRDRAAEPAGDAGLLLRSVARRRPALSFLALGGSRVRLLVEERPAPEGLHVRRRLRRRLGRRPLRLRAVAGGVLHLAAVPGPADVLRRAGDSLRHPVPVVALALLRGGGFLRGSALPADFLLAVHRAGRDLAGREPGVVDDHPALGGAQPGALPGHRSDQVADSSRAPDRIGALADGEGFFRRAAAPGRCDGDRRRSGRSRVAHRGRAASSQRSLARLADPLRQGLTALAGRKPQPAAIPAAARGARAAAIRPTVQWTSQAGPEAQKAGSTRYRASEDPASPRRTPDAGTFLMKRTRNPTPAHAAPSRPTTSTN